jgi:carbamoyl-phosphate synthase large subunit
MESAARIQSSRTEPLSSPEGGRELRLLITSAGRRVELLQCFRAAASDLGVQLTIFGCDLDPQLSAACRLADQAWAVPRADDPDYADEVLAICRREGVSLLVPTIDPELAPLIEAEPGFAGIGVELAIGSASLVGMARDKLETARFLAAHDIASPRTAPLDRAAAVSPDWRFPLIVKPRHGSASRGVREVADAAELHAILEDEPLIMQERLKGAEYTGNMFFDRSGTLRCAVPHERLQVRAGEVEKGRTRRMPMLEEMAIRIAEALPGPRGAMCFQAMVDEAGRTTVFEINARFGGGYPLAHRAGATMTRWLLEERLGLPSTAGNNWRENVAMLRYDAAVFLDS